MNFFEWLLFMGSTILANLGVDFGPPPVPGPDVETVMLVLYYSDGNFDFKNWGERILIDTGEVLQVKRNRIRPNPQLITNRWAQVFQPKIEAAPQPGYVPIKLDRKNGIVCYENKCTTLYAICPHDSKLGKSEKCVTFNR